MKRVRRQEQHDYPLQFGTAAEAETCIRRLHETWWRLRSEGDEAAAERVLETARTGKRRAEMIARNRKVSAAKRAEKAEFAEWFRIWLEMPDAFFDWLEIRKRSPEFLAKFGGAEADGPALPAGEKEG